MLVEPSSVVQLEVLTVAQAAAHGTSGDLVRVRDAPDRWKALFEKVIAEEHGRPGNVVARIMTSGAHPRLVTTMDILRGTACVVPVHVFLLSRRDYDRLSGMPSSSDDDDDDDCSQM